jgi:hypothetical protein
MSTSSSARVVQIAPTRVVESNNPFGVAAESDWLTEPRHHLPLWSETMFFMVWSPANGVGVWLHMGVVPEDKTLWWAQTYVMLPDGKVLVDRSFGRTPDISGPDTGNLKVTCVEPLKRWRLRFDGAGDMSSTDDLARGLGGAGIVAPCAFEIELDALSPVYDMHAAMAEELSWNAGNLHHEQTFAARGELRAGSRQWTFDDGVAVRDHSRGERDFKDFGGWVWNHAVWPESGRVMAGALMWRSGADRWISSVAMVLDNGRTEVLGDFRMTGLSSYGGHPRELQMSAIRADGGRAEVYGEVLHNVTMTYAEPNHNLNGALLVPTHGLRNQLVADESIIRWEWDGEIGYGHVERAFRAADLPMTEVPVPPGSQLGPRAGRDETR